MGSWLSLCCFPAPSEVFLMFLRQPSISMNLWEVAGAGHRMVVLVTGQTHSVPDKTWSLPPPQVPVRAAGKCRGTSFSSKGERGCRGVWELQKPLANSSFQAGALTLIVGSRKGGFTRAHGFRSEGFFFLFFSPLLFFLFFFFS